MHAVGAAIAVRGDQLGEDDGRTAVLGGVADVVLHRGIGGGVDDELVGLRVEGGGGFQGLHVGAVAALGHSEAAWQLQAGGFLDPLEVAFGAELI